MSEQNVSNRVVEYLKWHPNAKPSEIADYLGVSLKTVRAVLARLRARGVLVRTDKGYSLKAGVSIDLETTQKLTCSGSSRQSQPTYRDSLDSRGNALVDTKNVLEKIEELNRRVSTVENTIEEIKNMVLEIKTRSGDKDDRRSCSGIYEAVELLKLGLESIRIGDTHSLDNILTELETVLDSLRKCMPK